MVIGVWGYLGARGEFSFTRESLEVQHCRAGWVGLLRIMSEPLFFSGGGGKCCPEGGPHVFLL